MQLYLLRDSELRMAFLPLRVSGQHSVEYTSENGDVKTLLRINAKDGKWIMTEDRHIQISTGGMRKPGQYQEFELHENRIYYLHRENGENMLLMTEPETDSRRRFQLYQVPAGGIIDVGRASFNQIQFQHIFVRERRHLRITYSESGITVTDCEECEKSKKSKAYLNRDRIDTILPAKIGDVVFLLGLKIILGRDFIAVNSPDWTGSIRKRMNNAPSHIHLYCLPPKNRSEKIWKNNGRHIWIYH